MSYYNSSRELAEKADEEGGMLELLFGYGVAARDLPEDMPADIKVKFLELLVLVPVIDELREYLNEALEDDPVPGDWDYVEPEDDS